MKIRILTTPVYLLDGPAVKMSNIGLAVGIGRTGLAIAIGRHGLAVVVGHIERYCSKCVRIKDRWWWAERNLVGLSEEMWCVYLNEFRCSVYIQLSLMVYMKNGEEKTCRPRAGDYIDSREAQLRPSISVVEQSKDRH